MDLKELKVLKEHKVLKELQQVLKVI
jgi:hypothetical protein